MPVAVATPPVIVQDVGTNTAGFSPADDNGTEVCTGIVIEGPSDAAGALGDANDDDGAIACVDTADDGGEDGDERAEGDGAGVGRGAAFRLPACLPTKKAATQRPIRTTNPATCKASLVGWRSSN